jgi:hypothetical protein
VESAIGFGQQFSGCLEIHLSIADLSVTEISTQQRKARHDIDPLAVPEEKTGDRKAVTEVVEARSALVGRMDLRSNHDLVEHCSDAGGAIALAEAGNE